MYTLSIIFFFLNLVNKILFHPLRWKIRIRLILKSISTSNSRKRCSSKCLPCQRRTTVSSIKAVGWLGVLLSVVSVSQRSAAYVRSADDGPLANSSSCQRRSNHQNIIGVSEERPKQRALSSIRESLSRVNAISLRYPVDRYSCVLSLSVCLYMYVICLSISCARSIQLHMSPNMLANSAH